jgi:hypothetical protein
LREISTRSASDRNSLNLKAKDSDLLDINFSIDMLR